MFKRSEILTEWSLRFSNAFVGFGAGTARGARLRARRTATTRRISSWTRRPVRMRSSCWRPSCARWSDHRYGNTHTHHSVTPSVSRFFRLLVLSLSWQIVGFHLNIEHKKLILAGCCGGGDSSSSSSDSSSSGSSRSSGGGALVVVVSGHGLQRAQPLYAAGRQSTPRAAAAGCVRQSNIAPKHTHTLSLYIYTYEEGLNSARFYPDRLRTNVMNDPPDPDW